MVDPVRRPADTRQGAMPEPLGPWTAHHSVGATVVLLIVSGLGLTAWPGWGAIRGWLPG